MNPEVYYFLAVIFGVLLCAGVEYFLAKPYRKALNSMANLTAEEAQSLADIFQSIATRLKTGMYAKGSPLPPGK